MKYEKRLAEMERTGVVAGPSEKTFEERYGIKLHLPVRTDEFFRILDRRNLKHLLYAERGGNARIPAPWHCDKLNLNDVRKVYQIDGGFDQQNVRAIYRAYEDRNGRIVYVENTFLYNGL